MRFSRSFRNWTLAAAAALAVGYATLFPVKAQETEKGRPNIRYATVVKESTFGDRAWKRVVDALGERYHGRVFKYRKDIEDVEGKLVEYKPTDLALVGTIQDVGVPDLPHQQEGQNPLEYLEAERRAGLETVPVRLNRMADRLDDDPERDCRVGLITAPTPEDALRLATVDDFPIHKALLKAGQEHLVAFREGVSYTEDVPNGIVKRREKRGSEVREGVLKVVGQDIVNEINGNTFQLIKTTDHGSCTQWIPRETRSQRPEFIFISGLGDLFLLDPYSMTIRGKIDSTNPKVYVGNGNCRIGGALDGDSYYPAWIHSGGVVQFFGYISSTWFGGTGWAIDEHMFNNPEISWSDAHRMAEIGLQVRRERMKAARGEAEPDPLKDPMSQDEYGHLYDSDVLSMIGNPALGVTINFDPSWKPYYTKTQRTETRGDKKVHRFTARIRTGLSKPIIFPTEEDLTGATVTTNPPDLFVKVTDDAVVMDPCWQTVTMGEGGVVKKDREIGPGNEYTAELTVAR